MSENGDTIRPAPAAADSAGFADNSIVAGRYFIEGRLGNGGMALVYHARDQREFSRPVVLKTLNAKCLADAETRLRFRQEGEALAKLNDSRIVTLLASRHDHEPPFLVLEYVAGPSLSKVLHDNNGCLPAARACRVVENIAGALAVAHAAKIYHRDLKPANILLTKPATPQENIKLIDFGIAKVVDSVVRPDTTKVGFMGTPAYIAPEQERGEAITPQTDIYSLGVLACELLTGKPPSNHLHAQSLVARCGNLPAASQRALGPVLEKALAPEPQQRYATPEEFSQAFSAACQPARRRRGWLWAALALLLSVGAWQAWRLFAGATPGAVSGLPAATPRPTPAAVAGATPGPVPAGPDAAPARTPGGVPEPAPPARANVRRRISYALDVQQMNGARPVGTPFTTGDAGAVRPGGKYQLRLSGEQAGALYLLRETPGPGGARRWETVFPRRESNQGRAVLPAGSSLASGWQVSDAGGGTYWLIWSEQAWPELETALARPDQEGLAALLQPNAQTDAPGTLSANSATLIYRLDLPARPGR